MFKELAPLLRQRAVLLTLTHLEDDLIRVNVVPQKIKDGENTALTTPLSVTGTADDLDRDLPPTLVSFVGAHLGLKNTLDRVKEEVEAAAKAAQTEARSKTKSAVTKPVLKSDVARSAETPKPVPPPSPEPARAASLFDAPEQVGTPTPDPGDEEEVLENEQFTPECDAEEAA
jgi:PRTRC genetic system protein E